MEEATGAVEKALEPDPAYGDALFNRATYYLRKAQWTTAKEDLYAANKLGADIIEMFKEDYKDFRSFEQEARVTLPEDIVRLLTSSR